MSRRTDPVHVDSFLLAALGLQVALCGADLSADDYVPEGTPITCGTCAVLADITPGEALPARRPPELRRYERTQVARGLLRRGPDRWRPQLTPEQQDEVTRSTVLPASQMPAQPSPEICAGDFPHAHIFIIRPEEDR